MVHLTDVVLIDMDDSELAEAVRYPTYLFDTNLATSGFSSRNQSGRESEPI